MNTSTVKSVVANATPEQRLAVGQNLYFWGNGLASMLGMMLWRHQAKEEGSNWKSMMSLRKSVRSMGRHKGLSFWYLLFTALGITGAVMKAREQTKVTIVEFPPTEELFASLKEGDSFRIGHDGELVVERTENLKSPQVESLEDM